MYGYDMHVCVGLGVCVHVRQRYTELAIVYTMNIYELSYTHCDSIQV